MTSIVSTATTTTTSTSAGIPVDFRDWDGTMGRNTPVLFCLENKWGLLSQLGLRNAGRLVNLFWGYYVTHEIKEPDVLDFINKHGPGFPLINNSEKFSKNYVKNGGLYPFMMDDMKGQLAKGRHQVIVSSSDGSTIAAVLDAAGHSNFVIVGGDKTGQTAALKKQLDKPLTIDTAQPIIYIFGSQTEVDEDGRFKKFNLWHHGDKKHTSITEILPTILGGKIDFKNSTACTDKPNKKFDGIWHGLVPAEKRTIVDPHGMGDRAIVKEAREEGGRIVWTKGLKVTVENFGPRPPLTRWDRFGGLIVNPLQFLAGDVISDLWHGKDVSLDSLGHGIKGYMTTTVVGGGTETILRGVYNYIHHLGVNPLFHRGLDTLFSSPLIRGASIFTTLLVSENYDWDKARTGSLVAIGTDVLCTAVLAATGLQAGFLFMTAFQVLVVPTIEMSLLKYCNLMSPASNRQ